MAELLRYAGRASGRVQGVGFRMYVQQNARDLGLTGWVRNMNDGSVTMEIQGDPPQIEELERRIREGNYFIKVEELALEKLPAQAGESGFQIRY